MTGPVPVDVDRILADHARYVKGWADARAQGREGTSVGYAALAACRVADATPAVLAELVHLRAQVAHYRRHYEQPATPDERTAIRRRLAILQAEIRVRDAARAWRNAGWHGNGSYAKDLRAAVDALDAAEQAPHA